MLTVIFDIDGTLIQSSAIESTCYRRAVRDNHGAVHFRDAWSDYPNVSDPGILQDVCVDNNIRDTKEQAVRRRFAELIACGLQSQADICPEVPGALEIVRRLRSDWKADVGIATGGWLPSAKAKLKHIGIDPSSTVISSGDTAPDRTAIMLDCQASLGARDREIIYVGDGPWDAQACQKLGWHFIAVGPRLKSSTHNWCQDYTGKSFENHLERFVRNL